MEGEAPPHAGRMGSEQVMTQGENESNDHRRRYNMFITVRYGDNRQQIFNPNCRNNVLLHNIKERCDCDETDIVELSDETGAVKNLHKNLTDYGVDYFHDRETLVLLRVDKEIDGEDERLIFVPLVEGLEVDKEFVAKLNPRPSSNDKRALQDGRSSKTGNRKTSQKKNVKQKSGARNGGATTPKAK